MICFETLINFSNLRIGQLMKETSACTISLWFDQLFQQMYHLHSVKTLWLILPNVGGRCSVTLCILVLPQSHVRTKRNVIRLSSVCWPCRRILVHQDTEHRVR